MKTEIRKIDSVKPPENEKKIFLLALATDSRMVYQGNTRMFRFSEMDISWKGWKNICCPSSYHVEEMIQMVHNMS